MIDLRQAAQQALEALDDEHYVTKYTHIVEAITALREALEQPTPQHIATATHSTSSGRVEFTGSTSLTELLGRFGSGRLVRLYADAPQKADELPPIQGAKT